MSREILGDNGQPEAIAKPSRRCRNLPWALVAFLEPRGSDGSDIVSGEGSRRGNVESLTAQSCITFPRITNPVKTNFRYISQ